MKTNILPFLISTLMFCSGYGQTTFEKLLDSGELDQSGDMIQTRDSCFVWAASTLGPSQPYKVFVTKLDKNGDTIWAKTYVDDNFTIINSITEDVNGDLILVGRKQISSQNSDYYFMKLNSVGDSIFSRTYGGMFDDAANDILLKNGKYILIGSSASYSSPVGYGYCCIYMLAIDLYGDSLWSKTYEPENFNVAYQIKELSNGDLVFPCISHFAGQSSEYCTYLIKTDSLGNLKWIKPLISDTSKIVITSLKVNHHQDLLLGGTHVASNGVQSAFMCKTDSSGTVNWYRNYYNGVLSRISAIDECNDGNIVMCGYRVTSSKSPTVISLNDDPKWYKCPLLLMKVNSFGDSIWKREYTPNYSNTCRRIAVCFDGGLIVLGDAQSQDGSIHDIYIIKTYEDGTLSLISNYEKTNEIEIYPNPSDGTLYIRGENCNSSNKFKIININGQCINSGYLQGPKTLLHIPQKGIFVVEIDGPTKMVTKKILR